MRKPVVSKELRLTVPERGAVSPRTLLETALPDNPPPAHPQASEALDRAHHRIAVGPGFILLSFSVPLTC